MPYACGPEGPAALIELDELEVAKCRCTEAAGQRTLTSNGFTLALYRLLDTGPQVVRRHPMRSHGFPLTSAYRK